MSRSAMQQALEALEWANRYGTDAHGPSLRGAEHALRTALEALDTAHAPRLWLHGASSRVRFDGKNLPGSWTPLYDHPPPPMDKDYAMLRPAIHSTDDPPIEIENLFLKEYVASLRRRIEVQNDQLDALANQVRSLQKTTVEQADLIERLTIDIKVMDKGSS
jgi:hypothetical protein